MSNILAELEAYRPLLDVITALGSLLAVITWIVAIPLITINWWRGRRFRVEFNVAGIKAAALFGGASEHWASQTPAGHPKAKASTVVRTLQAAFDGDGKSRLAKKRLLWVDDRPDSVALEIEGFQALGADVTQRLNTETALELLVKADFDLVISDMGRPPDDRAGYTLLAKMRENGIATPVVIYSGSKSPAHVREAQDRGAQGATNDPEELLQFALKLV